MKSKVHEKEKERERVCIGAKNEKATVCQDIGSIRNPFLLCHSSCHHSVHRILGMEHVSSSYVSMPLDDLTLHHSFIRIDTYPFFQTNN